MTSSLISFFLFDFFFLFLFLLFSFELFINHNKKPFYLLFHQENWFYFIIVEAGQMNRGFLWILNRTRSERLVQFTFTQKAHILLIIERNLFTTKIKMILSLVEALICDITNLLMVNFIPDVEGRAEFREFSWLEESHRLFLGFLGSSVDLKNHSWFLGLHVPTVKEMYKAEPSLGSSARLKFSCFNGKSGVARS